MLCLPRCCCVLCALCIWHVCDLLVSRTLISSSISIPFSLNVLVFFSSFLYISQCNSVVGIRISNAFGRVCLTLPRLRLYTEFPKCFPVHRISCFYLLLRRNSSFFFFFRSLLYTAILNLVFDCFAVHQMLDEKFS